MFYSKIVSIISSRTFVWKKNMSWQLTLCVFALGECSNKSSKIQNTQIWSEKNIRKTDICHLLYACTQSELFSVKHSGSFMFFPQDMFAYSTFLSHSSKFNLIYSSITLIRAIIFRNHSYVENDRRFISFSYLLNRKKSRKVLQLAVFVEIY